VYDAATPSVAGFVDENNKALGKVFIATSPNGKKGNSYKKYKNSFDDSSTLMLHMPSNWVNPNMSSEFIRKKYSEDENVCAQEYWANFIDAKHGYMKIDAKVRVCEDFNLTNVKRGSGRVQHFLGVDQALSTDSFSVAVCHYDPSYTRKLEVGSPYAPYAPMKAHGTYVVDYIHSLVPTEDESLDIDDVINEIESIFRAFNIIAGGYDQWSKEFMEREFIRKGFFRRMKFMNASQTTNTEWAKMFKRMVNNKEIVWSPMAIDAYDISFSDEILALEEVVGGKHIKVEAPSGLHDDRYSAVTKALYLCMSDPKVKQATSNNEKRAVINNNSRILKQRTGRVPTSNNRIR
jgi:hypothetical protein